MGDREVEENKAVRMSYCGCGVWIGWTYPIVHIRETADEEFSSVWLAPAVTTVAPFTRKTWDGGGWVEAPHH